MESTQSGFAGRRGRYESRARLGTSALFKGLLHLLTGVPRDAGSYVVMAHTLADRLCAMRGEDPHLVAMLQKLPRQMRADEPRTASDQDSVGHRPPSNAAGSFISLRFL